MDKFDILDRMVRAGDVLLYPIDEIPQMAQIARDPILAYGEESGHKHLVRGSQVQVYETRNPIPMKTLLKTVLVDKFVEVMLPAVLVHENREGKQADHKPKDVEPGKYMLIRETEFQPFEQEIKQVED